MSDYEKLIIEPIDVGKMYLTEEEGDEVKQIHIVLAYPVKVSKVKELVRRWKSQPALLEANKAIINDILNRPTSYVRIKTLKQVQAAIKLAEEG